MAGNATRIRRLLDAPRTAVYAALLDPDAVARWMVPDGMTSEIHHFEAREGGEFRISLTYEDPSATGKTSMHTDTYHGRFVEIRPDEQVVQVMEFETADPSMQGEMRLTLRLTDAGDGTELLALHEGLPPGVAPADNEAGWSMALDKLATLVQPRLT